jgi:hypothetical protein
VFSLLCFNGFEYIFFNAKGAFTSHDNPLLHKPYKFLYFELSEQITFIALFSAIVDQKYPKFAQLIIEFLAKIKRQSSMAFLVIFDIFLGVEARLGIFLICINRNQNVSKRLLVLG